MFLSFQTIGAAAGDDAADASAHDVAIDSVDALLVVVVVIEEDGGSEKRARKRV